jgi:cysteinyl-tRNA synthetase
VAAVLDLDQLLTEWSSDLSEDVGYARTVFRQMIVRLGDLAGDVDPKSTALPAVLDLVIQIREAARASRNFSTADAIRDKLGATGIEIRDTPDGATWHLS